MRSEQKITLEPVLGRRSHEVSPINVETIPLGSELKFRLQALFLGREISLVIREVEKSYIDTWMRMKQCGLPVSPILRKASDFFDSRDQKTILVAMYDFTNGGSKVYGKDLSWELEGSEIYNYDVNEVDRAFSRIIETQLEDIKDEAMRLARIASEHDIVFPEDHEAFELLVTSSGDWKIIMIDTQYARQRRIDESKEDVLETNMELSYDFLYFLQKLNMNINMIIADDDDFVEENSDLYY